jgi:putative glycosyltransferase (TIGR04372 family)
MLNPFKKSNVKQLFNAFGISISSLDDLSIEILRSQNTKDPYKKLDIASRLITQYPSNPLAHLEFAKALMRVGDKSVHGAFDTYWENQKQFLHDLGLHDIPIEFVWQGMATGSFGNHYALHGLIEANILGLREPKQIVMLKDYNSKLTNPTLFEYFRPYIKVIENDFERRNLLGLERLLMLPLGACLPLADCCLFLDLARNRIEQEKKTLKISPLFELSQKHYEKGQKLLAKLGIPRDAWYATLHVREATYRGESTSKTNENFRNANIEDYYDACVEITKNGGWVFRMGDPTMSRMRPIPGVVDYAHSNFRHHFLDVFLAATSRFCIGTASGYFRVPQMFGVPVILTNCAHYMPAFSLTDRDILLPAKLKKTNDNSYCNFGEMFLPPYNLFASDLVFRKNNILPIPNESQEILASVKQMLCQTNKTQVKNLIKSPNQSSFMNQVAKRMAQYIESPLLLNCSISNHFFDNNAHLFQFCPSSGE